MFLYFSSTIPLCPWQIIRNNESPSGHLLQEVPRWLVGVPILRAYTSCDTPNLLRIAELLRPGWYTLVRRSPSSHNWSDRSPCYSGLWIVFMWHSVPMQYITLWLTCLVTMVGSIVSIGMSRSSGSCANLIGFPDPRSFKVFISVSVELSSE